MRCRWCGSTNVIEEHNACLRCCEKKQVRLTYLGEALYIHVPKMEYMSTLDFMKRAYAVLFGVPKEILEETPSVAPVATPR